jgi:hypothetical protein
MNKQPLDEKHIKYFSSYKPNDLYWGIGIENETYLEIPLKNNVLGEFFKNQKPERYSVNYFKSYNDRAFNLALNTLILPNKHYDLPLLMNCHELLKNDLSGQPMTNYDKGSTLNKKFSGKTIFEYMKEKNNYFKEEYQQSYCFDGDTIEFMTLEFYKTNIDRVIHELKYHKKNFLHNLNSLKLPVSQGTNFIYPTQNHGFATLTTNRKNISIFNNGTYHFNFTLPTILNNDGNIENMKLFKKRHAMAIRIIQVLEPFFIAKYGSGDILSNSELYKLRFPKGSQRVAASRYISAGTFDTNNMITGKVLQEDRKKYEPLWYKNLYKQINYTKNDKIGFDINYNKFRNHGIEIRFFDLFPEKYLHEVLEFIVHLLDHAETLGYLESCITNELWNSIMYKSILYGKDAVLSKDETSWIRKILQIDVNINTNRNILALYNFIKIYMKKKYGFQGPCSKYMLEKPTLCC